MIDLALDATPDLVELPNPYAIRIHHSGTMVEEVPWDFARHFADEGYRARSEEAGASGRRALAARLRRLRGASALTQQQLAERARVSRVTIARIEAGDQLPRYGTLAALAQALDVPIQRLLAG